MKDNEKIDSQIPVKKDSHQEEQPGSSESPSKYTDSTSTGNSFDQSSNQPPLSEVSKPDVSPKDSSQRG